MHSTIVKCILTFAEMYISLKKKMINTYDCAQSHIISEEKYITDF